jgi:hypothetical protein
MRLTRKAVLAGIASLAVAGAALAAEAPRFHTMTVNLPDGAVAHVRYSGDVAPTVTVDPAPARAFDSLGLFDGFDPAPFAALDRIAAEMDRQAAVMLRQARVGAAGAPGFDLIAAGGLPASAAGYSFVSQTTSDGSCTRSVEMTKAGPNAKPNIVTHESGDCDNGGAAPRPSAPGAPQPDASAALKPVKPAASVPGSGRI